MTIELHPVVVNSRSFGSLNGTTVFVTGDLLDRFTRSEGSDNGLTLASLQGGRALRGLKHLMERVLAKNPTAKLVLTLGITHKDGESYFVNFDDYRQSTQGRFFDMYRNVGLEASLGFLGEHFPEDFELERNQLSEAHIKTVQRNLPDFVQRIAKTKRNQPVLMEGTTSVVRELSQKRRLLKKEIEALDRLRNQSNVAYYMNSVRELTDRLASRRRYAEVRGNDSWQEWIHRNSWMFGPLYLGVVDRERVGFRDIPDFLFPTLDGFIDILEIKLPTMETIREDGSRPNAYIWSNDTNRAIGQVVNYMHQIDLNQLQLTRDISRAYAEHFNTSITALKPRAFILIGMESEWTDSHREAHRRLNFSLHGIEVITYDELLRRGKKLIGMYGDEAASAIDSD